MKYLLTILTLSLMLALSINADCIWTDPVQTGGTGTGTMGYVQSVSAPSYDCDICDAAPLHWFTVEILSVDPWEYELKYRGDVLTGPMPVELDCGWASIIILPYFPSPIESYAVGDTWRFGLE